MSELFIAFVLTWSVIDGDTIRIEAAVWPNLKVAERVRLLGVDTPELHKGPACERELAKKAAAFTQARLAAGKVIAVTASATRDDFGRVLGNVLVDGRSLAEDLTAAGLARPFGTKTPWCAP